MKVLVTGGTGFLGKNLVGLLERKGYKAYSASRKEGIDIRDYPKFLLHVKKIKPDFLIHCAAHVGGIAYNRLHPVEVFEDNVAIGINVVKACASAKVNNLINIMPNCVYPGNLEEYEESKFWDGPIHESVLTYGLPRKMFWGHCFAHNQKNPSFKAVHLVFPNMYGPNDHFEIVKSHALGALVSKIVNAKRKNGKKVEIWGTGNPIREWLYVEDGAEAALRAMEKFGKFNPNEIMNIGVKKGISIREMAELIRDAAGWKGKFIFDTKKPDGAMKKVLVAERMKKKLGWEPKTGLREGIKKTVEWYEQHYKSF